MITGKGGSGSVEQITHARNDRAEKASEGRAHAKLPYVPLDSPRRLHHQPSPAQSVDFLYTMLVLSHACTWSHAPVLASQQTVC
jgi:hypothetical protein